MKKMAILLALTAALVRQISFADSTDDTPPGASHFGGEWCKVYGTSSPGQFQEILAKQVGLGRWIAHEPPFLGVGSDIIASTRRQSYEIDGESQTALRPALRVSARSDRWTA